MPENNNNKCPLCGKDTIDDEVFCRDCQEIAQNSYSEELLVQKNHPIEKDEALPIPISLPIENIEDETKATENKVPSTYKNNKKNIIFVIIGLVLMLFVGSAGSYIFLQNKNTEETETRYWNQCVEENSPLAFSKYLVQYPDGKYSTEAQNRIIELRNKERKEWEQLRNSNDLDALFSFLTDHPQTPYTREIQKALDSLSWQKTMKDNTADSYLAYLENVNIGRLNGEYKEHAKTKYDYLSQLKTIDGEDLLTIKKEVEHLFKSLSDNNKDLEKITTPVLNKFFDAENQHTSKIIDSIKADLKQNKIKNISYTPILDSIDVIMDNKGIYFISLPVRTNKIYIDRKKKNETTQSIIHIEINDKKLFQTIYKN